MKNSAREICCSRGSAPAISNTIHLLSSGYRKWRIRRRAWGDGFSTARYSRNHCLTSIPNDAVTRLKMRDANQSTLTRMSVSDGWKEFVSVVASDDASDWTVALMTPFSTRYDAVCDAICCTAPKICTVVSGDNFLYSSTRKADKTAENRPACYQSTSVQVISEELMTHKN